MSSWKGAVWELVMVLGNISPAIMGEFGWEKVMLLLLDFE